MSGPDPYVTIDEAAALCGWTARWVYSLISDGRVVVKREAEPESGKKPRVLIQVASLPADAQGRYWSERLTPPAPEPAAPVHLTEYPDGAQREATRRVPIVLEALELLQARTGAGGRLRALATRHGVTRSTLYTWLRAYRLDRYAGLLPGWGKLRGRFTALPEPHQEFLKAEWCSSQQPSLTTVHRRYCAFCAALTQAPAHQATVARFIRQLPHPAVTLAREGPQAWRAECEPKIHRDFSDLDVGEIWVGDHREFDVFVRASDEPGARIFRPWLTAWLDLRSRAFVGGHIDLVPNSETIALALRMGILHFGVPCELYKDNGKDYRCHYLNGHSTVSRAVRFSEAMQQALQPGILSQLGITSRDCTPYTPWAKPIESWFGHTFPEWERTLPGWCGADNKQRPEKLAGEITRGELLTLAEFVQRAAARIDAVNAREHSVLKTSPISVWQGVTRQIPEPRALDLLLLRHKPCKVYAQGIKLFGRFYWHDDLILHVGHAIDARYDPNDVGRLIVFGAEGEHKGRFLCEALNRPAFSMHASREDLKALAAKKRAAKQRALEYVADRKVLFDQDQVLAELAAQRQAKKVVNLAPRLTAPGGPARRPLLGTEFAAATISARAAAPRPAPPDPDHEDAIPAAWLRRPTTTPAAAPDDPIDHIISKLITKRPV